MRSQVHVCEALSNKEWDNNDKLMTIVCLHVVYEKKLPRSTHCALCVCMCVFVSDEGV